MLRVCRSGRRAGGQSGALCPATGICAPCFEQKGGRCQPQVAEQAALAFVFQWLVKLFFHHTLQLFSLATVPCFRKWCS